MSIRVIVVDAEDYEANARVLRLPMRLKRCRDFAAITIRIS
jgi:hypothetical protein